MSSQTTVNSVLEVRGISKHFGGVKALDSLDLDVRPGEIVSLVGDNGAGKSTFVKLVSGLHRPTAGEMRIQDRVVHIGSPSEARNLGIETVYQDTGLVDVMDLGDNFFLGRELFHPNPVLRALGHLDRRRMHRIAKESVTEIGAKFTGTRKKPVGQLSGGQRASILTGRAAYFGGTLLLLDEPTAALGVEQSKAVLDISRRVADKGLAIIMVTHNMEEVFAVSDRIIVLRLGRKAAELSPSESSANDVVAYITGARS